MPKDRGALLSREDEFATIEKWAGEPVLVVVRGSAGAGKTALLREVRRSWNDRGVKTLHISFSEAGPEWDQFGVQAVVTAFRARFDELGDSQLALALAAVCRLSTPDVCLSRQTGAALFTELTRLFAGLARNSPSAVLFDDTHAVPDSAFAVAAARQAGGTVVATCRAGATLLSALADQVIELAPLSESQTEELVRAAAKGPLDEAVAPAVRAALGPLRGNPGAVRSVFDALRQDGRLTAVHGVLCLSDPAAPIALPPGHPLVRLVAEAAEPGPRLVAVVASAGRFLVDDLLTLAEAAGWDPAASGRAVDAFVAEGVLACEAGEGWCCPARRWPPPCSTWWAHSRCVRCTGCSPSTC